MDPISSRLANFATFSRTGGPPGLFPPAAPTAAAAAESLSLSPAAQLALTANPQNLAHVNAEYLSALDRVIRERHRFDALPSELPKTQAGAIMRGISARAGYVTGGLSMVAGLKTAEEGIRTLSGAKNGREVADGSAQTVSGTALTVSGAATVVNSSRYLAGLTVGATGVVAGAAGGVAAAADGVHEILTSNGDGYKRNVGIAKTASGTAMAVGAGMCATGIGAPVGAVLLAAGGVATAASYLADTEVGHKVTSAIADGSHNALNWAKSFF